MARRCIHGKRKRRSPLTYKGDIKKLSYKPETSKLITGGFAEGGASQDAASGNIRKIILGGELGYKTNIGSFSLKPSYLTEKSKYHNIGGGGLQVKYTANLDQLKKLFK
tara:strand:- start:578 stop:904 length:327 start_codon:yes stop_codon:yes gene_type:complete